jgi:antimicrobial peptide system SdpA family protein
VHQKTDAASIGEGFYFTASLLAVMLLASCSQLLPARTLPSWLRAERASTAAVWPQGWDFFAKEPIADADVAFTVADGGHLPSAYQQQMSWFTDWGLSRSGAAQYVEMGNLTNQIPGGDWLNCTQLNVTICKDKALRSPLVQSINYTAHATLCGHLLVAVESPKRWTAETRLWQSNWKILRIVNTEVTCEG